MLDTQRRGGTLTVTHFLEVNHLKSVLSHTSVLMADRRNRCLYCYIYYVIYNAITHAPFLFLKTKVYF